VVDLRGAGRRFVSALLLESEQDVLGAIRGYFIGRLLRVTPSVLSGAIGHDMQLWPSLPRGYRTLMHNLARSATTKAVFVKYSSKVTAEELLKWMVNPYPDRAEAALDAQQRQDRRHLQALASIIVNYPGGRGVAWLESQIVSLRQAFTDAMP
jgi:hypothetical protein